MPIKDAFLLFRKKMPVDIKSVLISDAVDDSCAKLLISHGVQVTIKYKLSKEELIKELQVRKNDLCF